MISTDTQFALDVAAGLSSTPKALSSKYFYDAEGDALFVKIMNMPEYYLTNCEYEILSGQAKDIFKACDMGRSFDVIELGAGDGTKTIELLKASEGKDVTYRPIDISRNALQKLNDRLRNELPWLEVSPQQGEYFSALQSIEEEKPKLILFLGSNIGNLSDAQAHNFLGQLADVMLEGDKLLLGVDRKKPRGIVLPAYNDARGYTRDFNLNLLRRINRELEADFNLDAFTHQPEYDEKEGVARSFLVSTCEQTVEIRALGKSFKFKANERIHTEISRKYDVKGVDRLIKNTGLVRRQVFTDERAYFFDILLEKTT